VAIITQLQAQKKNNERVNLFVDGVFFCGLGIDDVVKNNIVVNMSVTEEFLSNLLCQSGENDMYNKTLMYILKRPRTENEIKRYLSTKKHISPDMTTRIIDRLKTQSYINDEAYARMFTAQKHLRASVRAIKQKLRQKGIRVDLIDQSTAEIGDQDELCKTLAEKYMRNRENIQLNQQKLYRFLVLKGFNYDTISAIVDDFKTRAPDPDEIKSEYIAAREKYKAAKMKYKKGRK
jgi:regulatory protein